MFKVIRILILVALFIGVAFYSKLQHLETTSWVRPLEVAIYPINSDRSEDVSSYIKALKKEQFEEIELFLDDEYKRFNALAQKTISISLHGEVVGLPPKPPENQQVLSVIFWSLRMRWWSYQHTESSDKAQVNIFVLYHSTKYKHALAHSLGLQKGLIGVVNGYAAADYQQQNNIVITHELLHTVGASDKYDVETGQPVFPEGYAIADLGAEQIKAEIMAGKIPITEQESEMPYSLRYCMVGKITAKEIGWIMPD